MQLETMLAVQDLSHIPQYAAAVEAMGFQALWSEERWRKIIEAFR